MCALVLAARPRWYAACRHRRGHAASLLCSPADPCVSPCPACVPCRPPQDCAGQGAAEEGQQGAGGACGAQAVAAAAAQQQSWVAAAAASPYPLPAFARVTCCRGGTGQGAQGGSKCKHAALLGRRQRPAPWQRMAAGLIKGPGAGPTTSCIVAKAQSPSVQHSPASSTAMQALACCSVRPAAARIAAGSLQKDLGSAAAVSAGREAPCSRRPRQQRQLVSVSLAAGVAPPPSPTGYSHTHQAAPAQARPARQPAFVPTAAAAAGVASPTAASGRDQQHASQQLQQQGEEQQQQELRFPDSFYDVEGRLVLKNLTLAQLEQWCASIGERPGSLSPLHTSFPSPRHRCAGPALRRCWWTNTHALHASNHAPAAVCGCAGEDGPKRAMQLWRFMYYDRRWVRSLDEAGSEHTQNGFSPAFRWVRWGDGRVAGAGGCHGSWASKGWRSGVALTVACGSRLLFPTPCLPPACLPALLAGPRWRGWPPWMAAWCCSLGLPVSLSHVAAAA